MSRRRIGFWYRFAAFLVKPTMLLLFSRDWRGVENIPATGGFITAVNHNSHLDPLSYAHFQYNTGRVPRFLAKNSLFRGRGIVGSFMRSTGQIPVYRDTLDAAGAFRAAVQAVHSGECVAFYPEGTLTRDPDQWPMQGKTGVARVALETRAPVIPVAQWGANEVLPPYAGGRRVRLLPRRRMTVVAGPPVDLSEFHGREIDAELLRRVTDRIMDAVTVQLAGIRNEEPPRRRWVHKRDRVDRAGAGTGTGTGQNIPGDTIKETTE
ncbi:1-acyl-sn-glycerol-3-phosphate acyltransferase [Streptomyces sp. ST2-7A]|uniref:lysophospholipid acyltransferase family protein n=1 Tax=Streptomyces sp. ST2-7A TaxID=2907214 RepID=UPI001F1D292C|nr:lysophospholipid acyltransferase family protein [Streptomyces sp. ST2-7A]MCE7079915.1 1-acyl-sn-glycerol-3-phosphate acyltransferase [Streptomyces sp. ST2-7A]